MTAVVLPGPLQLGDRIVVVSPSGPLAALVPRRRERAIAFLRASGYDAVVAPSVLANDGRGSSTGPQQRADEIHSAFEDPRTRLVLSAIGGLTANLVLPYLQPEVLRANPTWFCGYSDATAISLAVVAAGVASLSGPQLLPQFGESGGVNPFVLESFTRMMAWMGEPMELPASYESSTEILSWDREDSRPRRRDPDAGPRVIREGSSTGTSIVGNLDTILRLAGTTYQPRLTDSILLLEQADGSDLGHLWSCLGQLTQLADFDQVRCIGFGRFAGSPFEDLPQVDALIEDALAGFTGPIVAGLDIGHVDPILTVPVGVVLTLEAAGSRITLRVEGVEGGLQ